MKTNKELSAPGDVAEETPPFDAAGVATPFVAAVVMTSHVNFRSAKNSVTERSPRKLYGSKQTLPREWKAAMKNTGRRDGDDDDDAASSTISAFSSGASSKLSATKLRKALRTREE